jgi:hypothetical protein
MSSIKKMPKSPKAPGKDLQQRKRKRSEASKKTNEKITPKMVDMDPEDDGGFLAHMVGESKRPKKTSAAAIAAFGDSSDDNDDSDDVNFNDNNDNDNSDDSDDGLSGEDNFGADTVMDVDVDVGGDDDLGADGSNTSAGGLFQMQVEELLRAHTTIDSSNASRQQIQSLLKELGAILYNISERSVKLVASWEPWRAFMGYYGASAGSVDQLDFKSPLLVAPIGSYATDLSLLVSSPTNTSDKGQESDQAAELVIDVAVVFPVGVIREKDLKNYRYHQKRLAYLLVLLETLQKPSSMSKLSTAATPASSAASTIKCQIEAGVNVSGDMMAAASLPSLTVRVQPSSGHRITLRLLPAMTTNTFKFSKVAGLDLGSSQITENYKSSILQDLLLIPTTASAVAAFSSNVNQTLSRRAKQATLLLKLWMRRRMQACYLTSASAPISGFIPALLVGQLLQGNRFHDGMSIYQIFKMALQVLSRSSSGSAGIQGESLSDVTFGSAAGQSAALRWLNTICSAYSPSRVQPVASTLFVAPEAAPTTKPVSWTEPSGWAHVLSCLPADCWNLLASDAALSLKYLDSEHALDGFSAVFLTAPSSAVATFDMVVKVEWSPSTITDILNRVPAISEGTDNDGTLPVCEQASLLASHIDATLRQALGQRANHLVVTPLFSSLSSSTLPVHLHNPAASGKAALKNQRSKASPKGKKGDNKQADVAPIGGQVLIGCLVGLKLNPETWRRLLDPGPDASASANIIQSFKDFWGDKVERRRFKDGRILHSVLWSRAETEKHLIVLDVARYVLGRHVHPSLAAADGSGVTLCGLELDQMLLASESPDSASLNTIDAYCKSADQIATQLKTLLMDIAGGAVGTKVNDDDTTLPLGIRSVRFVNSSASFTAAAPPCRLDPDATVMAAPMRVVVQFEASGSWPDTLDAIADVKAAFYLRIAASLSKRSAATATPAVTRATPAWVDIHIGGYLFRLVIYHPREVQLLQQRGDWRAAYALWFEMEEHTRLSSSIRALALQHPAFGPTASLLKRWLSAQLVPLEEDSHGAGSTMSSMFFLGNRSSANPFASLYDSNQVASAPTPKGGVLSGLLVDLLVAHVFLPLNTLHLPPPTHYTAAFFRALQLLASHDWTGVPLIVDLDSVLNESHRRSIESDFEQASSSAVSSSATATTPALGAAASLNSSKSHPAMYIAYSTTTATHHGSAASNTSSAPAAPASDDIAAMVSSSFRKTAWRSLQSSSYHWGVSHQGTPALATTISSPPSRALTNRVSSLARQAIQYIGSNATNSDASIPNALFTPSYSDFDVVIQLDAHKIPTWSWGVHSSLNYVIRTTSDPVILQQRRAVVQYYARLSNASSSSGKKKHAYKNLQPGVVNKAPLSPLIGFDPVACLMNSLQVRSSSRRNCSQSKSTPTHTLTCFTSFFVCRGDLVRTQSSTMTHVEEMQ